MTPPPARVLILKNERRSSCFIFIGAPLLCSAVGGEMNGFADSKIRSATADIARHGRVDLRISGFGCLCKKGSCGHDLSSLTISALRYVDLHPRLLQSVRSIRRQSFNGCDGLGS